MKYIAFISYKHESQTEFAERLELDLMKYGSPFYKKSSKIFRDEKYIKAGEVIPTAIRAALEQSEFLILLASPESAQSNWVEEELEIWCKDLGRAEKLIIILTSGSIETTDNGREINWRSSDALPLNLSNYIKSLPLWVDVRDISQPELQNLRNPSYKSSINTISARLRDIDPNAMTGQEIKAYRKNMGVLYSGISLLLVLAASLSFALINASQNAQRAIDQSRIAVIEAERANSATLRAEEEARRADEQRSIAEAEALRAEMEAGRAESQRQVAVGEAERAGKEAENARAEAERAFRTLVTGASELSDLGERIIGVLSSSSIPVEKQIEILQALEKSYGNFSDAVVLGELRQTTISNSYERLAAYYYSIGQRGLSLNAISEITEINRQLVADEPENPCWKSTLAVTLLRLANEKAENGDVEGQLLTQREAYEVLHATSRNVQYDSFSAPSCPTGRSIRALSAVNQAVAVMQLLTAQSKNGQIPDQALLDASRQTLLWAQQEFPNDEHVQNAAPQLLQALGNLR